MKPEENPEENGPVTITTGGVPYMLPIPCDIKAPLQHLTSYVFELTHRHALLEFFGELNPLVGPMYIPEAFSLLTEYLRLPLRELDHLPLIVSF